MEKCPAPSTKQSVAALSFYKEEGCTQVVNKMNAELLHLFMQQNCLEQYLVLWWVIVQWTLVDSENVRAGTNLSIHAIHRFHFTVNKTKAQSWEDTCPKTAVHSQN